MKPHNISSAQEVLEQNETAAFLTSGASMYPLLRTHKDIVVISRVSFPLKVGDVALYKKQGFSKLVLHRVIGIKPNGEYIIRGDNTYFNENVSNQDILGVMIALYRGGKYIDCQTSKRYKIYVVTVRLFYPLRRLWVLKIRPMLSKIKHQINSKTNL